VIFLEYAVDTAKACHALGIRTVAVTAGYVDPEPRAEFFRHVDAANVDLKGFSERFYETICGARLAPVLDTLAWLRRETSVWLEVTTLLIPGENDSDEEIARASAWFAANLGPDVPWHFTAFHPDYRMRDRPPTPPATLTRAREIARRHGIRHAYSGNVYDPEGQSTRCHACGVELVGRDGYRITSWRLGPDGRCAACGERCAGVFEPRPGAWGARRRPVRLADFAAATS
jgi:pyruvate formate lyase activating enzyme